MKFGGAEFDAIGNLRWKKWDEEYFYTSFLSQLAVEALRSLLWCKQATTSLKRFCCKPQGFHLMEYRASGFSNTVQLGQSANKEDTQY